MYLRSKEIVSHGASLENTQTQVFHDGVSASDIRQGSLGDCYLLSAMSVVAHARPELLKKIFHPDSRTYRSDGLYTMMFYSAKQPVVITVDDQFMCKSTTRQHAFVKLSNDENGVREIWPLLLEKAYAKMYGSYSAIEGGQVGRALEQLTNGAHLNIDFRNQEVQK